MKIYFTILFTVLLLNFSYSQDSDTSLSTLITVPNKFFTTVSAKAESFIHRSSKKSLKTLYRLSKWEQKIRSILERTQPDLAKQLFADEKRTFAYLYAQLKTGEDKLSSTISNYNARIDKLSTSVSFLTQNITDSNSRLKVLAASANHLVDSSVKINMQNDAVEKFIAERKDQLVKSLVSVIGSNKLLSKISKEVWYYKDAIANYKELFSNPNKIEEQALLLITKIPAFNDFFKKNSLLSSLFPTQTSIEIPGLQTRQSVLSSIQSRITNSDKATQMLSSALSNAQEGLNKLKSSIDKNNDVISEDGLPDFKPNHQKSKLIRQRFEFGNQFQFNRIKRNTNASSELGFTVGYKLNDKSIVGIGANYKMSLGKIERIRFKTEGIRISTFLDYKLKHQLFISGGLEYIYTSLPLAMDNRISNINQWTKSAMIGLYKKIPIKLKGKKAIKLQLLYDLLNEQHLPYTQRINFRMGYIFK